MKTTFAAAAVAASLMFVPAAFADCAGDLAKVDDAMKTMKLDEANTTKAKELMDKAKAAQTANDETTCLATAQELMTLVGMPAPAQ